MDATQDQKLINWFLKFGSADIKFATPVDAIPQIEASADRILKGLPYDDPRQAAQETLVEIVSNNAHMDPQGQQVLCMVLVWMCLQGEKRAVVEQSTTCGYEILVNEDGTLTFRFRAG